MVSSPEALAAAALDVTVSSVCNSLGNRKFVMLLDCGLKGEGVRKPKQGFLNTPNHIPYETSLPRKRLCNLDGPPPCAQGHLWTPDDFISLLRAGAAGFQSSQGMDR